ncbi:hypothetical protein HKBW3S42_02005, partial [Candidatus Hakubella thermalkaliphila]
PRYRQLVGRMAILPLLNRELPIIEDNVLLRILCLQMKELGHDYVGQGVFDHIPQKDNPFLKERGGGSVSKFAEDSELLKCSFCGKNQRQVKKLIAGPVSPHLAISSCSPSPQ